MNIKELFDSGGHKYPYSRDWIDIDCTAVSCKWNKSNKCSVPSLAIIGEDGRCNGFKTNNKGNNE